MKPFDFVVANVNIVFFNMLKRQEGNDSKIFYSKIFWFFVLIFYFPDQGISQTAIVTVRMDEVVYIAAESRKLVGGKKSDELICKIRQINQSRNYFASAGLFDDPDTGFYLPDIVNSSFNSNRSFRNKVFAFEQNVMPQLINSLTHKQINFPQNYRDEYMKEEPVSAFSVVFVGNENDSIVFYTKSFRIESHNPIKFIPANWKRCPGSCYDGEEVSVMGLAIPMLNLHGRNCVKVWKDGIVVGMRRLISAAIQFDSTRAGHPINVIKITKRGAQWIDPKPPCPN